MDPLSASVWAAVIWFVLAWVGAWIIGIGASFLAVGLGGESILEYGWIWALVTWVLIVGWWIFAIVQCVIAVLTAIGIVVHG